MDRRPIIGALIFLAAAGIFSWDVGILGVEYRDDEIFYVKSTQEMLREGNFLSPTFLGENRFQKPILYYWLVLLSYGVLGPSWFAARMVAVLFAAGTVTLTWRLALEIFRSPRMAVLSSAVLMSIPLFLRHARNAVPDMPLNFFIILALYAFWRATQSPGRRRYVSVFYAAMAAGFMIKGLAAAAVPLLTVAVFAVLTRKMDLLRSMLSWRGAGIFVLITLPWFVYMLFQHGSGYGRYMLEKETQERILGPQLSLSGFLSTFTANIGFYLQVLFFYFMPWFLFLLAGSRVAACGLREGGEVRKGIVFLSVWAGVVILIFACMSFRISHYILVLSTPFAILTAFVLCRGYEAGARSRACLNTLFAVMIAALGMGAMLVPYLFETHAGGWPLLIGSLLLGSLGLIVWRRRDIAAPFIFALWVLGVCVQGRVMVDAGIAAYPVHERFARTILAGCADDCQIGVGSHDIHEKELQVFFDRKLVKLGADYPPLTEFNILAFCQDPRTAFSLTLEGDYRQFRELYTKYGFYPVQEERIFRKRLHLDRHFVVSALRLDREALRPYLMEKIILLKKDPDDRPPVPR